MMDDNLRESNHFEQRTSSILNFEKKRKMTVIAMILRMFLYGVEYTMILPSVWPYLKEFNASRLFLGFVIASASFSAMLCLPLLGRLYDYTKRLKEISLVINSFAVLGNIIYSMYLSQWCPLIGRLISGTGSGFIAVAVAEIGHIYPREKRTGVIALIGIAQVVGFIIGPALNFFVEELDFTITGEWKVDSKSGAGFVLAILWTMSLAVTYFCVANLAKQIDTDDASDKKVSKQDTATSKTVPGHDNKGIESDQDCTVPSLSVASTAEDFTTFCVWNENALDTEKKAVACTIEPTKGQKAKMRTSSTSDIMKELRPIEFPVILTIDITLWFSQTVFTVFMPPLFLDEYDWSQVELSAIFLVGSLEVIVILLVVMVLSRKHNTKDIDLIFYALALSLLAALLVFVETFPSKVEYRTAAAISSGICGFAAFPLNLVSIKAQLNKITRPDGQGTVQAVEEAVSQVALVLGPIVGSLVFQDRHIYTAIMVVIFIGEMIALILCKGRIIRRQKYLAVTVGKNNLVVSSNVVDNC